MLVNLSRKAQKEGNGRPGVLADNGRWGRARLLAPAADLIGCRRFVARDLAQCRFLVRLPLGLSFSALGLLLRRFGVEDELRPSVRDECRSCLGNPSADV